MGELKPYPVEIAGTYLVTGVHDGRGRNGSRFLRLGLTDGQRPTIAYACAESGGSAMVARIFSAMQSRWRTPSRGSLGRGPRFG